MRHTVSILLIACIATLAPLRPAPCETTNRTFEDASVSFIHKYMEQWSAPNPEALAYMNRVFPDQAGYFTQTLTHAALMQAKRRFAERWPVRRFTVRNDDLSVSCDKQHLCTVWGLIDWHCSSPERHADAIGTSIFVFQIQDGQTVLDENGFVIARGQILPPNAAAQTVAPKTYSNGDIPMLRRAFYQDSGDRDWITRWLTAAQPFSGVARSLGQASARDLTDSDGFEMPYAVFQSAQGPIACMMTNKRSMPPPGEAVHVQGTVAIFIDKTMYLAHCSFS
jgi:hypothetical protein